MCATEICLLFCLSSYTNVKEDLFYIIIVQCEALSQHSEHMVQIYVPQRDVHQYNESG